MLLHVCQLSPNRRGGSEQNRAMLKDSQEFSKPDKRYQPPDLKNIASQNKINYRERSILASPFSNTPRVFTGESEQVLVSFRKQRWLNGKMIGKWHELKCRNDQKVSKESRDKCPHETICQRSGKEVIHDQRGCLCPRGK